MWEGLRSCSLEEGGKTHLPDKHYDPSVLAYRVFPINFVILFSTNSGPESSDTTEATRPTLRVPMHSMLSLPSFLPLASRQHPPPCDCSCLHLLQIQETLRGNSLFFSCTPYPYSCFLLHIVIRKCQKQVCIRRPTSCTWTSHLCLSSTRMGLLEQTLSRRREIHGHLGRPSHFPKGVFTPWQVIYPGAWPGPVSPPWPGHLFKRGHLVNLTADSYGKPFLWAGLGMQWKHLCGPHGSFQLVGCV